MSSLREELVKGLISLSLLETDDPEISVSDLMQLPHIQQISESISVIASDLSDAEKSKSETFKILEKVKFSPPEPPQTNLDSYR